MSRIGSISSSGTANIGVFTNGAYKDFRPPVFQTVPTIIERFSAESISFQLVAISPIVGATITYALTSGTWPSGISMTSGGLISGSITNSGSGTTNNLNFYVQVTATDSNGNKSYPTSFAFLIKPALLQPGSQLFIASGNWQAPAAVTSVNVVAIGGGGGGSKGFGYNGISLAGAGGGGLGWKNNITVIPGDTYTVVVGGGGPASGWGAGTKGNDSYFINATTVQGGGSQSILNDTTGALGGTYVGDGGGNGGQGGSVTQSFCGPGGGGAGGYTGAGGKGGNNFVAGDSGSGGGGGGGGGATGNGGGGGGGGVGTGGQGASGTGGAPATGGVGGGLGGTNGSTSGGNSNNGSGAVGGDAGVYGAAGGSVCYNFGNETAKNGAGGAVRIIWGSGRSFPSNAA
jgi:hypothetical protein